MDLKLLVTDDKRSMAHESFFDYKEVGNSYIEQTLRELGVNYSIQYHYSHKDISEAFEKAVNEYVPFSGVVIPVGHGDISTLEHMQSGIEGVASYIFSNMIDSGCVFEAWRHVPGHRTTPFTQAISSDTPINVRSLEAHPAFKTWVESLLVLSEK